MRRYIPLSLCFYLIFCSVGWGAIEKASLSEILHSAIHQNGDVKMAQADVDAARAQLEQARAAMWPRAQALFLAAPMPEVTGDPLSSRTNFNRWGPFVQGQGSIIQPIYTFGQISNYKRAAENQIAARSAQVEMKQADVILQTKEFYYGYQMASELESLVSNLVSFLEEAVEAAEKNLSKKNSTIKPHDVYRLKDALMDLRQKHLLAEQSKQTALKAIQWVSGLEFQALKRKKLDIPDFELKPVEDYLKMAISNRPEFRALKSGQMARAALRDAKRAQSYPTVFLGGYISKGYSPVATRQPSFFANDPFNRLQGGGGVGVMFNLEFKRHSAEAAQEEAERMKLVAQEELAAPGIDLQVRKAYWEMDQAIKGLEVAKERRTLAKKWFFSSASGWSIGITPAKDLMEALEGEGKAKQNYIETVYFYNMSLARLSQATGKELLEIRYADLSPKE